MLFGLGIDYLLPQQWFAVQSVIAAGADCSHCLSVMDWVWVAVLVVLLLNAFWQQHHGHACSCGHEHEHHHHCKHENSHEAAEKA